MKDNVDECPYSSVNIFSHLSVSWMNPLFEKGYKQKLSHSDLGPIADYDKSSYLTDKLERSWNREVHNAEVNGRRPSFIKAFLQIHWLWFLYYGFVQLLLETFRVATPLLIGELSLYFASPKVHSLGYAYAYACGVAFLAIAAVLFNQLEGLNMQRYGWNARTAVVGLMYKKTLKLHHEALSKTTTGSIVNLSSTDALRFDEGFHFIHYLWLSPLQCIVVACLLWGRLGVASLVGMSVLFVVMMIQALMGGVFANLRLKAALATDKRVDVMSEIISGMRIIKLYSWEKAFKKIVTGLRKTEMHKIFLTSLMRSFNYTLMNVSCLLPVFTTFLTHVALGGALSLQTALVVVGLFNVMRLGVGVTFPLCIENLSEVRVSLQRTEEFLLLPEKAPPNGNGDVEDGSGTLIMMKDFTGSWNQDEKATLENLSLNVEAGKLLMVIGPVGSGKSSLLCAILNELPVQSGEVKVDGKIAYSSQISWLLSESVRDNILFDNPFDPVRYKKVVKACALEKDFQLLPQGDSTLVGERGVTLSGGQKARVGLARTAYCSDSDIALFDDPLSAVDPAVANHLFDECICGFMKDKARILVTHQVQFLDRADEIVVLKDGRIEDRGTLSQLQGRGTDVASLVGTHDITAHDDAFNDEMIESLLEHRSSRSNAASIASGGGIADEAETIPDEEVEVKVPSYAELEGTMLLRHESSVKFSGSNKKLSSNIELNQPGKEPSAASSVGATGYSRYLRADVPIWYHVVLLVVFLGSHVLLMLADWWLLHWAAASEEHNKQAVVHMSQRNLLCNETTNNFCNRTPIAATNRTPADTNMLRATTKTILLSTIPDHLPFNQQYYVILYAVFTFGFVVSMYTRTAMNFYLCMRSSIQLHAAMLSAILGARMRFFDTNPVGGVLNRFSKDMNQVDEMLSYVFVTLIYLIGFILTIFVYVMVINYLVIIIVIPIGVYCVWIRRYYVTTSREIKRIEGSSRSPVFSHLSSTLQGLPLIRSFRAEQSFIRKHHELHDSHGAAWAGFLFGSRWFAFRLDMMTSIFVASCAFSGVVLSSLRSDDWVISAADLGLTLTSSVYLLVTFQWAVRQTAELENLMTSVERIREYHKISPESDVGREAERPPSDWPKNGEISFKNVSYAYFSGGPLVLRNINLNIKPREKLGVVGRTGAGKSSLIAAIFRMSDHVTGSITIDGIDTSHVALHDLRSSLAIIPQDPILFGGTVRKNLDAFSSYTDDQLWSALEQVQLKSLVEQLPLKLESELKESGGNLSAGQRQLVCLARAILRKSQILIIDEATANVDFRTDQLIQETIRERFASCTVLTVAHRLHTVISSDRILVLENGVILECNHPHLLLQVPGGVFPNMVGAAGDQEKVLRTAARKAYFNRFPGGGDDHVSGDLAPPHD